MEVAGMLVCEGGIIRRVFPHSGHYRPGDRHVQFLLKHLEGKGVDLATVEVDGQHTMKVARLLAIEGTRLKKKERPHFLNGKTILSFLEMKAWSTPLFEELIAKQRTNSATRRLGHFNAAQDQADAGCSRKNGYGHGHGGGSSHDSGGSDSLGVGSGRAFLLESGSNIGEESTGDIGEGADDGFGLMRRLEVRGTSVTGLETELGLSPLSQSLSESPLVDSRSVQGLDLAPGHAPRCRPCPVLGTELTHELSLSPRLTHDRWAGWPPRAHTSFEPREQPLPTEDL